MSCKLMPMRACAMLAMPCLLAGLARGDVVGGVKYVAFGWDTQNIEPAQVCSNLSLFAATPFDGMVFRVCKPLPGGGQAFHFTMMNDPVWPRKIFSGDVPVCRRIASASRLKDNFYQVCFSPNPRLSWKDDAAWARIATSMDSLAWAAKEGALKGICADFEDYHQVRQFIRQESDLPYDQTVALARRRGAEVFRAAFRTYPEMTVIFPMFLTIDYEYRGADDPAEVCRRRGDLLPAFFNGVLDVLPPTAKIVDGSENDGYECQAARGGYYVAGLRQRKEALQLVAPENRARHRSQVKVGFGQYLDSYTTENPKGYYYLGPLAGSRLGHFIDNLRQATLVADEYVWIYGERGSFVRWKNVPGWTAHRESRKNPGLTWEEQLPGFNSMVGLVKDPVAWLPKVRASLFRRGAYSNLVPRIEAAGVLPKGIGTWQDEKRRQGTLAVANAGPGGKSALVIRDAASACFTTVFRDLAPGAFYVLAFRSRGEGASATAVWAKDGGLDWRFGRRVLAMGEVGSDGWRRSVSLFRVPDGSRVLQCMLGAALQPGESAVFADVEFFQIRFADASGQK